MGGVSPVEGTINQPDLNARFRQNPFPGLTDPNWSGIPRASSPSPTHSSVRGGPGSPLYGRSGPMAGKKGLNWEEIIEVMNEMEVMEPKFVTDQASQSGQDFKLSLMDQASPDVGNLGLAQEAFWKKKLGYA